MSQGVALITGAAKRIGRAIALELARQGYDLVLHYGVSYDDAKALRDEITAMGRKAIILQADLTQELALHYLFSGAVAHFGAIDVLVNNASLFQQDRLESFGIDSFTTHQLTNLFAPLCLSKAFASQDQLPANASIINIIDQRVRNPSVDFLSYGLSKSGLWYATEALARQLAPSIRVNAIGPGPSLASIHQTQEDFAQEVASTPLQRPSLPEDIAACVLYLLAAKSVTGQMICVDSGQHLSA